MKIELDLDREKAIELSIWIEMSMFRTIREDEEIDNLDWIEYWISVIRKLESAIEVERKKENDRDMKRMGLK